MDEVTSRSDNRSPTGLTQHRPRSRPNEVGLNEESLGGEIGPGQLPLTYLGLKRHGENLDSPKPKVKRLTHDEQMEILRRLDGMETGKKLAQDFGVSCTTITVLKRKFGIPVMKKGPKQDIKKLTEDEKAKIACRLAKETGAPVMSEFALGTRRIWDNGKESKHEVADCTNAPNRKLSLYDKVRIIEKVKNMESENDIGHEYGVCSKTVSNIWQQFEQFLHFAYVKANNATQHRSSDRDSKRRHTRLTISQKVEILLRLKGSEQGKALAKEFGVGTSTISDIKKGEEKILYIAEKQGVDLSTLSIPCSDPRGPRSPQYTDSETGSTGVYTPVTCYVDLVEGEVLDSEENENTEPKLTNEKYKESVEQYGNAITPNVDNNDVCDEARSDDVSVKMEDEENPLSDESQEDPFSDTSHGEAYAALATAIKWAEQQIEVDSEQILTLQAIKNIAFRKHLLNLNFGRRNFIDA